ncbi:hypothetical protein GGS20DRAFT_344925 [Poronia punctata]|nr:hypothetical protein GGS20DRAFT_344925 [Poronia punctata]
MYSLRNLASIVSFLPLALSAPTHKRETAQEFQITALNGRFPTDGPYGTGPIASSLSITISYPDSSSSASNGVLSTTCSYSWSSEIAPGPTAWSACEDPSLQWRLPAAGWTSTRNFRVEVYEGLQADGAGLTASHYLTMHPGDSSDPNAYLSCIQMGKFTPDVCQIDGSLSAQHGPVVMSAEEVAARPS